MEELNIYQKLVEVRKQVSYLQKKDGNQYAYVSSSQVLLSIKDKLDEIGLLLIPEAIDSKVTQVTKGEKQVTTYFTEINMMFTWINIDNPSETIKCKWYAQGVDVAGEKGVGKAYTYAEKYFILKSFNIATDKLDPDVIANNDLDDHINKNKNKISEKQLARLFAIMKKAGQTDENVKTWIKNKFGIESKKDLNKTQYDLLCTALESKIKAKEKEAV